MQQKTKFIIYLTLTCSIFLSLLFLPVNVWGSMTIQDGGGGGDSCCKKYDYLPDGCGVSIDNDLNSSTYGHLIGTPCTTGCVEWDTTSPGCGGGTDSTTDTNGDSGHQRGYNCHAKGSCSTGIEVYCSSSKDGEYKKKATCEAACAFHCGCQKQFFGVYKCKPLNGSGADVCKTDADCNSGETPPPKYSCNTSIWTCSSNSDGAYSSLNTCEDNCIDPSETTSTSSCSVKATASPNPIPEGQNEVTVSATNLKKTSLGKCKVSNYSLPHTFTQTAFSKRYTVSCSGNSGYSDCSSKVTVTRGGETPNGSIPPPPLVEPDWCEINKFELPKRAWVDIETTATWSTNNCDTAEINCISDDCIEGVENLSGEVNPGFDQKKNFTIKAPGTYRYELKACNENNCATYEDVLGTGLEYIEIEALHLPWWQEIIPFTLEKLQGFLRGLTGDR